MPVRLAALLTLCLGLAGPALGCGPYRVAFYEYAALYHRDADGQYRGIDKDLIDELARRSGCRFETVLESRARTWALMASGGMDITVSAVITPERQRVMELVPYVQSHRVVLLHNHAVPATAEAFLADAGRRLLMVRTARDGPQMETLLARLRAQGRIVEATDQPSAIRAFKAGRADALLLGTASLARLRQEEPSFNDHDAVLWAPTERVVAALAMSRTQVSEPDRMRLREALLAMRRDGSLEAILRSHVGDKLARAMRVSEGDAKP